MKIFLSEIMAVFELKAVEIIKTVVTGLVCIVAIKECGIFALLIIAFVAILKTAIEGVK